jgi:hypothetical protein
MIREAVIRFRTHTVGFNAHGRSVLGYDFLFAGTAWLLLDSENLPSEEKRYCSDKARNRNSHRNLHRLGSLQDND